MLDIYPGAEQHPADSDGGTYIDGVPWRVILHTIEGDSLDGATSALDARRAWSHLAFDPETRRTIQYIGLTRAARSTKNAPGGVETNRCRAIQVELRGTAVTARHWPAAWLDAVGDLIATLVRSCGIPLDLTTVLPTYDAENYQLLGPAPGQYLASPSGLQRLTPDAWLQFGGVCCHQHVPENDHWDCGALDLAAILRRARAVLHPDIPTVEAPTVARRVPHPTRPADRGKWPHVLLSDDGTALLGVYGARLEGMDSSGVRKFARRILEISEAPAGGGVIVYFDAPNADGDRTDRIAWA